MKNILSLVLVFLAFNCKSPESTAQGTNLEETEQSDILTGKITKEDLMQPPHVVWFDPMYRSYKPDPEQLEIIKKNINDYKIRAVMGTWCVDSKREIPKFFKLLELSHFDMKNLDLEGVTRAKELPGDEHTALDVHRVPTIIFYKDGKEVGRFVEYPQEEFENDIAKIVSGKEYRHSYQ